MTTAGSTETAAGPAAAAAPRADYLSVVLEAARPEAGGLRLCLDGLDELAIGRGDHRGVEPLADSGARRAWLRLPDRRLSSRHARIRRALGGWELCDDGSKNGSVVDGQAVTSARLGDGATMVLGQSVLRLRTQAPRHGPAVADGGVTVLGVTTLSTALSLGLEELTRLAGSQVSIVLGGETGTGKELLARAIHAASGRRGPLVAVNCAALPAGLIESELFGYRRGAFSGAVDDRPGLVRAADGGTLLLDEVGELPAPAQAALLRVLQEREVVAIGDTRPVAVDVRVIAASHHDLAARCEQGAFRADLLARLSGHTAVLPPLRARREDIGAAIAACLRRHAGARAAAVRLEPDAALALCVAPWPHNLRGLDKAIEAALVLAGEGPIGCAHLPPTIVTPAPAGDLADDALRDRLEALLLEHRGNISRIARDLGKARMQVQRWLRRFELDAERFRR